MISPARAHIPLQLNAVQRSARYDPTRTTGLRQAFVSQVTRRFAELKKAIRRAIIDRDCFGLQQSSHDIKHILVQQDLSLPARQAFNFPTSAEKKQAFLAWLQRQEDQGLLETMTIPQYGVGLEAAWTDRFIKDSYERGVQRARYELSGAGYPVPSLEATGGLIGSMSLPLHIDRLGVLYSRCFDQLRGISAAMDSQISHILAQGLADGDNPLVLAKSLVAVIDGEGAGTLGITDKLGRFIPAERRARMLARTEIIRAHAQGTLQEAKNWGAAGVEAEVEFVNAGFNVCSECVELQGKTYTIEEAMNIIPVHPHCRCAWIIKPIERSK